MSFTYVKIPVSLESPIEEITTSKSGGLENDELIKQAKDYFHKQGHTDHPSCDIMALSIPLPGNNYRAVSLYANDNQESLTENKRATALVTACGHTLVSPIRGDVFLGRAHDDESIEWERDNFTIQDANPTSEWCRVARSLGGGGGQGGKAMPSLNNLVQQQVLNMGGGGGASGKSPPQVIAPPNNTATGSLFGMDGAPPVEETWGSWIQSSDEVELKFIIPESCKGKDCQINFQRNQLSVSIQHDTKLKGGLFSSVVPDECTYTIESTKTGKELCITLTKANEDTTWSFITS